MERSPIPFAGCKNLTANPADIYRHFQDNREKEKKKKIGEMTEMMINGATFSAAPMNGAARQEQRLTLDSLTVIPAESMPEELYGIYKSHDFFIGRANFRLGGKRSVTVIGLPNGITVIRELEHSGLKPYRTLNNFFYIDRVSRKAFDATQLWKTQVPSRNSPDIRPTHAMETGLVTGAAYLPARDQDMLMLNRFMDNVFLRLLLASDQQTGNRLEILDISAPFHESGHRLQYDQKKFPYSKYGTLLRGIFEPAYLPVLLNRLKNTARKDPQYLPLLQAMAARNSAHERNAWAFGLSAIRRIKHLGVDIFRDTPAESVIDSAHWAMHTHDQTYALASSDYKPFRLGTESRSNAEDPVTTQT